MTRSKTTITVETWQITSVKRSAEKTFEWCRICESETEALQPAEAARRFGADEREIFRQIGTGKLHIVETGNRVARICSKFSE